MKVEFKINSGKKVEMIVGKSIISCKIDNKEIGGRLERDYHGLPNGYVALVGGCLPINQEQLELIDSAIIAISKRHISDICPKCNSYCYGDCRG